MVERRYQGERLLFDLTTDDVMMLYLGDSVSDRRGETIEERDEAWNNAAQMSPEYSDKIRELRQRLKVVEETKKAYPKDIVDATQVPFNHIIDRTAAYFLSDVLLSRLIATPGYIDPDRVPGLVALTLMAEEMGLPEGWNSQQARGIKLHDAVGSVLQGKLRVSASPH